jgi:VanZ family protein
MKPVLFIPALGYSALIVWLSAQSNLKPPDIGVEWNDKVLHAAEYFIFSILWCFALLYSRPQALRMNRVWALVAGAALFAVSDELHQAFVPGRQADVFDLLADLCGISMGVFVFLRFTGARSKKRFIG